MGAGFAKHLSSLYPEAKQADYVYSKAFPPKKRLGRFSEVKVTNPERKEFTIINFYTQLHYSRTEKVFDELAFAQSLAMFHEKYGDAGVLVIPPIGCGLAGGDFDTVADIINQSPVSVIVVWRDNEND